MFDIILAHNNDYGIGLDNKIPWKCKEDLKLFSSLTFGQVLIVGKNTFLSLPPLKNRIIYVLSSTLKPSTQENVFILPTLQGAIRDIIDRFPNKKIFIAGGAELYKNIFEKYEKYIDNIHVSHIYNNMRCDTFFNLQYYLSLSQFIWKIKESISTKEFEYTWLEKVS